MTPLFFVFTILLGLIIGSFLNVVILRLPVMMHRIWRAQCDTLSEMQSTQALPGLDYKGRFNLVVPNSHCPQCQRPIRPWENIPLLSFILLKGRCAGCHHRISYRYPLIEILTAMLTLVTVLHFGFQWPTLFALILTWGLIAQAVIDFDHQMLPDDITLPLLWLGLILSLWHVFQTPQHAIAGAVLGYLTLWSVYWLFKILTKKEGMGHGDFKLLALMGAWLGWQALPAIILMSAFSGAVIGISLIVFKQHDRHQPIPFGPFIAIAGWIVLLWGDKLNQTYLRLVGLS